MPDRQATPASDPIMRVTLVTETYAPQVNGVSRTLGQLARVLRESGDEVQLVHPDYGVAKEQGADYHVRSRPLPFYREVRLPIPPFGRVHRAISAFRPDLVHVATEATLGLSVLRFALGAAIPVVSSFHTNFDQYTSHYGVGPGRGLIWRYLRWFHNRTRETYVPSLATIADLTDRGFERLVLWPRGVHADVFRPGRPGAAAVRARSGFGPGDVVIAHVGRLAVEKNVGYLADSLALVAAERPATRLLFVGDGPSRPAIERQLGGVACFAGYRGGDELADYYSAADLFAFASKTETFGNVVLEAMASGLPVVALAAGGVLDTVRDGVNGTLVPPDDPPRAMADALIALIDDPEARRRRSEAARAHALDQSWDAIMQGLRGRYRAILESSPRPVPLRA